MFCTEEELIARCSFSNRFDTYLVLKPQTKEKKKTNKKTEQDTVFLYSSQANIVQPGTSRLQQKLLVSTCCSLRQMLFSQLQPNSNKSD